MEFVVVFVAQQLLALLVVCCKDIPHCYWCPNPIRSRQYTRLRLADWQFVPMLLLAAQSAGDPSPQSQATQSQPSLAIFVQADLALPDL